MSRARQPTLLLSPGADAVLTDAFNRFWAAYPQRRPNPRSAALATFALHVRKGVPAEQLVQAAEAFAAEMREFAIRAEFVPHARTWLAQQRYRDYPPFAVREPAPPAAQGNEPQHPWWPAFRGSVPPHEFRAFVAPLAVLDLVAGESALLRAPTRFVADTARARYGALLCHAL